MAVFCSVEQGEACTLPGVCARALGVFVGALAAFGALGVTRPAEAAPESERAVCIAAAERGQKARKEGRLPDAQRDFLVCGRVECPAIVRTDCAQWLTEVETAMPSIVVAARLRGNDLFDVRVIVDGEVATERLDGKGIAMSTGEHALRFEYGSLKPVETKVLMREGDKNRPIDVVFEEGGSAGADAAAARVGSDSPSSASAASGGGSVVPWIVTGVGAAAAITGVVLYVTGNGRIPDTCSRSALTCQPGPTQEETDARIARAESAHSQSNVGLGVLIGGAVVAAGGLVWHFLMPSPKAAAPNTSALRITPSVGAGGPSFSLTGQF
jgi:hypothetical protein